MSDKYFSSSVLERDPSQLGGKDVKVHFRGYDEMEYRGVAYPQMDGSLLLAADLIVDKSRNFDTVTLRINNEPFEDFKVIDREDGMRVIRLYFKFKDTYIRYKEYNLEVFWEYTNSDMNAGNLSGSTVKVILNGEPYDINFIDGATVYTKNYVARKSDLTREIAPLTFNINKPSFDFTGLLMRYWERMMDEPLSIETTDFTEEVFNLPIQINKSISLNPYTLKVDNKKIELVWKTAFGNRREVFKILTNTIGYEEDFTAPIRFRIDTERHKDLNIESIREIVTSTEEVTNVVFKAYNPLEGDKVNLITKYPINLPLADLQVFETNDLEDKSSYQECRGRYTVTEEFNELRLSSKSDFIVAKLTYTNGGVVTTITDLTELV